MTESSWLEQLECNNFSDYLEITTPQQAPEYEGRKSVLSVTSGYDVSIRVRQTESVYAKNKGEVLRKIFDMEQFETRTRKFVDEIKTNGYGASVTMIRSVTTASVVVVEKQVSTKKAEE
ncbi:hypothetical protein L914_08385 [Phytophthora nicotianae]|uniref:Uncharacterized protein n=1 Tax=Phytophthora nicotianae TaxID=4792 RepID=W2NDX3_PHYNI|nr:hypothetical protein L914_08385 [Phytophthora nicotianae]